MQAYCIIHFRALDGDALHCSISGRETTADLADLKSLAPEQPYEGGRNKLAQLLRGRYRRRQGNNAGSDYDDPIGNSTGSV